MDQRLSRSQILVGDFTCDDQFFVTDSVCYDLLLCIGIDPIKIHNPIDVLLSVKPSSSKSILDAYTLLESSVHDYLSYMQWMVANQYLIYLLLDLFLEYNNNIDALIVFEPLVNANYRTNCGLPLSIFFAYRRLILARLAAKKPGLYIRKLRYINIHRYLIRVCRDISIRLLSGVFDFFCSDKFNCTNVLLGTCIPESIISRFQRQSQCLILTTPRDFSGIRSLSNRVCFLDYPNPIELRLWASLLDHLFLGPTSSIFLSSFPTLYELNARFTDPTCLKLCFQILVSCQAIYKSYLSKTPFTHAYLSDHVNLDFYAILSLASTSFSQSFSLLKHGKQRSSPFALSSIASLPSIRYWSEYDKLSTPQLSRFNYLFPSSTPLIVVSYASYKPHGFKIDPSHVISAVAFLNDLHATPKKSCLPNRFYVVKKAGSEASSTQLDIARSLAFCTMLKYDDIKLHPSALILAVGQLGTAHIDLYESGYRILYFGTCVEQAPINMLSVHINILSDSSFCCNEQTQASLDSVHTGWLSI